MKDVFGEQGVSQLAWRAESVSKKMRILGRLGRNMNAKLRNSDFAFGKYQSMECFWTKGSECSNFSL